MENRRNNIVVSDICHTLYKSNTTFDFFRYLINKRKLSFNKRVYFGLITSKFSPFFWLLAVNGKIFKVDIFKTLVVRLLKSLEVEKVEKWADEFFVNYLQLRTIKPTITILKKFDFSEVILISATLYPVAKSIAKHLGIKNYIATELEVKDNKYTGKISFELSGKKLEALYSLKKEEVPIDIVITDNFTDHTLMAAAKNKYAVCYNRKQIKFWSSLPQVNILKV